MKTFANIARIFTGIVFVFSGFVKGEDPLGFSYKLEDYFIAWHAGWLMPYALIFSIVLCTIEFSLGVFLLLKIRIKLTSWLVLLMMIYFTVLTFFDAIYNPVPDCGCFGDAIKLTNWQTFYKNVVLIILAITIFEYRGKFKPFTSVIVQKTGMVIILVLFAGFSTWSYLNLPIIDFTEWKVGHKLYVDNPQPLKYYLTYRNKETKEQKEFLSPNYPYSDSVWMSKWEFVSQKAEDPNQYYGKNLMITDTLGVNQTNNIIKNPDYQLIININNISRADEKGIRKVSGLCDQLEKEGVKSVILVSALPSEISGFIKKFSLNIPVFEADDIILKTMVRSNPGLMLLHKGTIVAKWHYRNIPRYEKFKIKYLEQHTSDKK